MQAAILQNGLVSDKKISPTVPLQCLAIFSRPVAATQKLPGGKFFFKPSIDWLPRQQGDPISTTKKHA